MNTITILQNINRALRNKNVTIRILREEPLNEILPDYYSMLIEYGNLTEEERINLFEEVNIHRPVVGLNLKTQWDSALAELPF